MERTKRRRKATQGRPQAEASGSNLSLRVKGSGVIPESQYTDLVSALPDWQSLWKQLGSYAPDAPQPARDAAAQQWDRWLAASRPIS